MPARATVPKHYRRKRVALSSAIVSGMAALPFIVRTSFPSRAPRATASAALRSDWLRIGADFGTVLERRGRSAGDAVR